MDDLTDELYAFAEENLEIPMGAEYCSCLHRQGRHMETVREQMGREFADKLSDALAECAYAEKTAAFRRGLRLGLTLQRM